MYSVSQTYGEGKVKGKRPHVKHLKNLEWVQSSPGNVLSPYYDRWFNVDEPLNIAITVGFQYNGLYHYVIDCDNNYDEFLSDHPELFKTLTIKTGSGGYHFHILSKKKIPHKFCFYYKNNENKIGELMAKGYVLGPGSLHRSGNYYEYINKPDKLMIVDINSLGIKSNIENKNKSKKVITNNISQDNKYTKTANNVIKLNNIPMYGNGTRFDWIQRYGFIITNNIIATYGTNKETTLPHLINAIWLYNDGTSKDYTSIDCDKLKSDCISLLDNYKTGYMSNSCDDKYITKHAESLMFDEDIMDLLKSLCTIAQDTGYIPKTDNITKNQTIVSDAAKVMTHIFGKINYDFEQSDKSQRTRNIIRELPNDNYKKISYELGHAFMFREFLYSNFKAKYGIKTSIRTLLYGTEKRIIANAAKGLIAFLFKIELFHKDFNKNFNNGLNSLRRISLSFNYYNIKYNIKDIIIILINNNNSFNIPNIHLITKYNCAGNLLTKTPKAPKAPDARVNKPNEAPDARQINIHSILTESDKEKIEKWKKKYRLGEFKNYVPEVIKPNLDEILEEL